MIDLKLWVRPDVYYELKGHNNWSEIHCCTEHELYVICGQERYLSTKWGNIRDSMHAITTLFPRALCNELVLPAQISDIGRAYNDMLYQNRIVSRQSSYEPWIGLAYSFWQGAYTSWIYNDRAGNIILEITPVYPNNFLTNDLCAPIEELYAQWISAYKPVFKDILSSDVVKAWIKKAAIITQIIDMNKEVEINYEKELCGDGVMPQDGQKALYNSVKMGANTTRRVGVSRQEFVILYITVNGIYRGYVVTWHELRRNIGTRKFVIDALIAMELIDEYGLCL